MKQLLPSFILLTAILAGCESERIDAVNDPSKVTFVKQNGADPTQAQNQDRLTDNVWITRGNDGGQIFNARISTEDDKDTSPLDTEWALGTTDALNTLTFDTFRNTISPRQVVGKDLVMHLITDDVYVNVRFTSWSSGKEGGFAYIRDDID